MKKLSLFIILFLSLIFQNSKAQTDVLQDSRVNPLLKQVALKRPGLRIFGRQKETDKYVNMAVLEESRKMITWFTCYGQAFDSAQLTNSEYNQIVLKSLDPFTLYKNISYENIFYVESAEGTYRLKGKVALQDTSYNNHVVFNAAPVVSAQSTLQKLMAMEGLLKKMCTQLRLFDSRSPSHLIGNDSFGIRKALAGKMIIKADSTVYYNIDPLAPVAKIMLSKHVPEKIFVYNRQEHLIDSVPLKPQKFALLLKQKEDVFLLYRGWLEMQWQLVADSKQENIRWLSKPDSGLYKQASLVENSRQLQNAVMQLQVQQRVIEDKISNLIVPEGKDVEQLLIDLYRDKPSEISYAPWGFGYTVSYIRGNKRYELTNHLGNVLAVVSDKKNGADENGDGIIESYNADVISAYDYYPFGSLMPGRTFSSDNNKYRYGFNGKENDNEVKGEGNQQDYGFRIYDPRIGKFLSVDPLTKSYPELTPYQFAGNMPIRFIDLDGLEPADPGKKKGDYTVAAKKGTEDYFGWRWNDGTKGKKGFWEQGASTKYMNGNVFANSGDDDLTKTHYPDQQINSVNNSMMYHSNSFPAAFELGMSMESDVRQNEGRMLIQHFTFGNGSGLSFKPNSEMASMLGIDPNFVKIATGFETKVLTYLKENRNLEEFNGTQVLRDLGKPYIKDRIFMYTVLGGTQQIDAQIRKISANEIRVQYTVWDHFGAGRQDAVSKLPGLPSMYYLQHNANSPAGVTYKPFIWNIRVNR
ncbi:RHS repeat-associated core domain-containing protein [Chitinophaga sp. CF118]|uniref:RHS repeat domain-containing protein n=1 Tax=Chitinophaga sp. CF118 TaxID=1884367 RepID=UPI0008EB67C7|nr:RHS repeat-associated core domain-containing protein [Chitinophaga sp. CF118]SFF07576.1 RHS repeat-associated core domain-containing protein [Chitinophaga sp. CF118]